MPFCYEETPQNYLKKNSENNEKKQTYKMFRKKLKPNLKHTLPVLAHSLFFGHRPKRFWNDRKKFSHFRQNVRKYRL